MRIGIVGLGDIAKKAYLPVLSNLKDVELLLCTRNESVLKDLQAQYHVAYGTTDFNQLLKEKPDAVFVTAATSAHYELAKQVLEARIPCYVDKPLSMDFDEAKALTDLALTNDVLFMTGFNRRFVPLVQSTLTKGIPDIVLYQKNRKLVPDEVRRFVVEDFVHVVDTCRYLLQAEVTQVKVTPKRIEGKLAHIVVQFTTPANQAIAIMNYLNGTTEEVIEVMHPYHKTVIANLAHKETYQEGVHTIEAANDWMPTLKKRGFVDMTQAFLSAVKEKSASPIHPLDALRTHELCETIVNSILENEA